MVQASQPWGEMFFWITWQFCRTTPTKWASRASARQHWKKKWVWRRTWWRREKNVGLFYTVENPTKCATSQKMLNDKPLWSGLLNDKSLISLTLYIPRKGRPANKLLNSSENTCIWQMCLVKVEPAMAQCILVVAIITHQRNSTVGYEFQCVEFEVKGIDFLHFEMIMSFNWP